MAFAMHVMGDRMIERAVRFVNAVGAVAGRAFSTTAQSLVSAGFTMSVSRILRKALPKKEVKRGGYIAAGQCW